IRRRRFCNRREPRSRRTGGSAPIARTERHCRGIYSRRALIRVLLAPVQEAGALCKEISTERTMRRERACRRTEPSGNLSSRTAFALWQARIGEPAAFQQQGARVISASGHYDLIVVGSGPGGASLAHALAPTGKRILILERGGYLPRSEKNWDSQTVFVDAAYQAHETWTNAG